MLYIKFDILDHQKFTDFTELYKKFSAISLSGKPKPTAFWLALVPDYVKTKLNVVDYGESGYDEMKLDFDMTMDYLQINLEVDYGKCEKLDQGKGVLEFAPFAYPYGGIDRLIKFLSFFDCPATLVNSGFGDYLVTWTTSADFDCKKVE